MTTIKTTMTVALTLATLAAGLSGADARGFGGGGGFGGNRIAIGEPHPGGFGNRAGPSLVLGRVESNRSDATARALFCYDYVPPPGAHYNGCR